MIRFLLVGLKKLDHPDSSRDMVFGEGTMALKDLEDIEVLIHIQS